MQGVAIVVIMTTRVFALNQNDSDESPSQDFHSQCERSLNPKAEPFKSAFLFVDHDSMCCCKQQELIVLI